MTDKEIMEALRKKLDRNMSMYQKDWQQKPTTVLVDMSKEIAATQFVYNEVYGGSYPLDYMEYLLRFENPLEVIRDQWISEQTVDFSNEMHHVLWMITDKRDVEHDYVLDPEYQQPPDRNEPVTVREFIERHPNVAFDMMTPGGYVYLTPERAKLLLSGQNVKGHPGSPEYAMEIPAEELLDQEVFDPSFRDGAWHFLSDYIRNQEQTPFEQGVTMC
jgi:hypothetical protein